jgi:DNA-binding NarL/FixJ family response regulator
MARRVLVVDDTDHLRTMLVHLLDLDGFDVVGEAADMRSAVEAAVTLKPDVVIMDLKLPDGDGIIATGLIRKRRPEQQVILYTAYLDPALEPVAREMGVTICLEKAHGFQALVHELDRITLHLTADSVVDLCDAPRHANV